MGSSPALVPAAAPRNSARRYRIINIIVGLQILTIIISRGDVTFLANLYAFGVIWSFAMKGLAVLVLRYTHPGEREFRVPLNFHIFGVRDSCWASA